MQERFRNSKYNDPKQPKNVMNIRALSRSYAESMKTMAGKEPPLNQSVTTFTEDK